MCYQLAKFRFQFRIAGQAVNRIALIYDGSDVDEVAY